MTAHILTIGDEILIGQIIDSNSAWMAEQLNLQGVRVTKIISISDTEEAIRVALDTSFKETDLILMTGGLGPTKDDITKKTLAAYYGVDMSFHEPSFERLSGMFARWGRATTPLIERSSQSERENLGLLIVFKILKTDYRVISS